VPVYNALVLLREGREEDALASVKSARPPVAHCEPARQSGK
jgi:hypothetical protein